MQSTKPTIRSRPGRPGILRIVTVLVALVALVGMASAAHASGSGTMSGGDIGTITIAPDRPRATGKFDYVHYTLTRSGPTTEALTVTVGLEPPAGNDWATLDDDLTREVTFAASASEARLTVGLGFGLGTFRLGISSSATTGGTLGASLGGIAGYDTSDTAEVEVVVVPNPLWTFRLLQDSFRFDEDGGPQTVVVEAYAASPDIPPPGTDRVGNDLLAFTVQSLRDTADSGDDYEPVSRQLAFPASSFSAAIDGIQRGRVTFTFTPTDDALVEGDEALSFLLERTPSTPSGIVQYEGPDGTVGDSATYPVTIADDDNNAPTNAPTVVTITAVPDGTVIPDRSSLWVGETVEDGSTFVEGTRALFRLEFEALGGGPPVGDGVDVHLRFSWHIPSPLVTGHGQVTQAAFGLRRTEVWDTAVQIHDNDLGHPDGTVTISITGCERSGCIIGTPSVLTLTIADDDGGLAAAVPGPLATPRLACAPSGDGYDDTGIAVSWEAPTFVGGAPVESYELRSRQSSLHPWEYWPGSLAATSATLTGLVTDLGYAVQVRAVNDNGPGPWSRPNYFRVGPPDIVCEIIDGWRP